MLTLAISSLSGGQGKTTTTLFLGRRLESLGIPTLLIDADPQHNLSVYLGLEREENEPSLLEFIKKNVDYTETIYPSKFKDLFVIPADESLDDASDYLSSSGVGATLLKRRLDAVRNDFKVCLIDSPPQRSQLALTVIGASNGLIIPAEANLKGFGSLIRTLELLEGMVEIGATEATVWGVLPFRDRWVGRSQTNESKLAIEGIIGEVGKDKVLPSIRESEKYKQAINKQLTLTEMGFSDLEYPFETLTDMIQEHLSNE